MTEMNSELMARLVTGRKSDGRCRYDPQAKLELVRECLKPGVSVAKMALRHGINANLLRKWITKSFDRSEVGTSAGGTMKGLQAPDAFVPVRIEPSALPTTTPTAAGFCQGQSRHRSEPALMRLQVRLPNGVTVDLGEAGLNEVSPIMQMLSHLPCSN
jgi:transposase